MLDDRLKLFAMTNLMFEEDIKGIERQFDCNLRLKSRIDTEKDNIYYPQFDEDVRIEAASMVRHYEVFYCLEKTIREFIRDRLYDAKGGAWWEECVPPEVQQSVEKNITKEMDAAVTLRSKENIDYTTFGQLSDIIIFNWTIFGDTFNSKKGLQKVFANLNVLRGPIAHCSPLQEREVLRLRLTIEDWFTLME